MYEEKIRPILAEANVKRYGHTLQKIRLNRSLATETISNASYFAAAGGYYALTSQVPDLKDAFIGAIGVSLALLYKRKKQTHRIKQLEQASTQYAETGLSKAFDDIGCTFRGNRPLNTDDKHNEFHILHNPLNVISSLGRAIDCTWQDLITRPSTLLREYALATLGKAPAQKSVNFTYSYDNCCADSGAVMQTKLPHINNDATVQMPASEERLRNSISWTNNSVWRGLYSDYAELAVNLGGAIGAAEFCYSVGKATIKTGIEGYETGSPAMLAFAALSAFTVYVGTDPLQNFLDDAENIHKKLNAKLEILTVKKAALKTVQGTVKAIREKLTNAAYIDAGKIAGDADNERIDITILSEHIERNAIPDDLKSHMQHRNVPVPELIAV